jgi:putative Ca2+/H+ antiporter (TMEM165/GDT1 family)
MADPAPHCGPGETIGTRPDRRQGVVADACRPSGLLIMEALLVSIAAVTLAEIGDKTQLLALMLAVRYRRPWPIVAGILVATLFNHTLAAALGSWLRSVLSPGVLKWIVALAFFAVAIWTLLPDRLDEDDVKPATSALGVFGVTTVAFFLAEMGDKTQIATALLGARFDSLTGVVAGTTLGMLIADVPAVFAGHLAADRIPMKLVRGAAAAVFTGLAIAALLGL